MPAAKLTTQTNPISTRKPVRLSERCGVSSAENNSGCGASGSNALPAVMALSVYPDHGQKSSARRDRRRKPRRKAGEEGRRKAEAGETESRPKPKPWTAAEVHEAFSRFRKANPEPKGELEHLNPYTLLVAVVLSAQATDAGVNKATRALFAVADTPQKMLALGEEKVRDYIKTIGLYRNKAKNVIALSEKLIAEFGSEVPRTRAEIESLPGAGRKTANVVLNMAFGEHTMAVDTHVFRVGNRTGMAPGKTPLEVELGLEKMIPSEFMLHAHHWLILHGRYTCLARRPALRGVPDQRSLPLAGEDGVAVCTSPRHCGGGASAIRLEGYGRRRRCGSLHCVRAPQDAAPQHEELRPPAHSSSAPARSAPAAGPTAACACGP